jgi:hypothetical protein
LIQSFVAAGLPLDGPAAGMRRGDLSLAFLDIGPVELKGVSGAVRLHSAHRKA